MASFSLASRSGLEHALAASRHAVGDGRVGVTLALCSGRTLAIVTARRNQLDMLAVRVRDAFGLALPQGRKCVNAGSIALIWSGLGQWLAMADGEEGATFERRLRASLDGLASVCDQSDGRTIIRVGGARARDVLAKGVPIDLHPRAFRPDDAAVTTVAHIGAQFWQVDDTPTYEFIVARSFAAAFWEWLRDSAAEFGYGVAAEGG